MMERHETRRKPTMVRLTEPQIEVLEEVQDEHNLSSQSDAQRLLMREGARKLGKVRHWDAT